MIQRMWTYIVYERRVAPGVMIIVVENGHDEQSSSLANFNDTFGIGVYQSILALTMNKLTWSLVWFNGTSTFEGNSMMNIFLYIYTVPFQTIQFKVSIQFQCQKKKKVLIQK